MKYQTISLKQFFAVKGTMYYVAIATVMLTFIFTREDIRFLHKSSPGISLVFI